MDHLNSKHLKVMIELGAAKKQSQAKLTDFKFMKPSNQEKFKASNPKQKQKLLRQRGLFRLSMILILRKYLRFKNLDPKINVPHSKTNFSEKYMSIDISLEVFYLGYLTSSWGDLTLEQSCFVY